MRAAARHAAAPVRRSSAPRCGGARARHRRAWSAAGSLQQELLAHALIEHLEDAGETRRVRDVDVAFVDESQDLTAVDLKALKLMTRRGRGDGRRRGPGHLRLGSPYKRAGIDISGRTRILRTDFRTTCPIHEVAGTATAALRPATSRRSPARTPSAKGPSPELYTDRHSRRGPGRPARRAGRLFIDKLGYDPENITVLAPAGPTWRASASCSRRRHRRPRTSATSPSPSAGRGARTRFHPALQQGPGLPRGAAVPALAAGPRRLRRRPRGTPSRATSSPWP